MIKIKNFLFWGIIAAIISIVIILVALKSPKLSGKTSQSDNSLQYREISFPTPNYDPKKKNDILGVILHHTAEPTIEKSLSILSSPEKKVGTHVVIDVDGTRYIMAAPSVVTYHAGYSILNDREGCNYFTIGIEFQGNTLITPLTKEQIASGIEYLIPLIKKNKIPLRNIVTHQMVRDAYMQKYPEKNVVGKSILHKLNINISWQSYV